MSPTMSEDPPLVRVELEYADGRVDRLVGPDAQKWFKAANGAASVSAAHGFDYFKNLGLKWETTQRGGAPT
jgi:hypothetical protein